MCKDTWNVCAWFLLGVAICLGAVAYDKTVVHPTVECTKVKDCRNIEGLYNVGDYVNQRSIIDKELNAQNRR